MSLELERYKESRHLITVSGWGDLKGFPFPPKDVLPEYGLVASNGEQFAAIGFLYRTDSNIGWIEWIFGNPDLPYDIREQGIKLVIEGLKSEARHAGMTVLFSSTKHERLLKKYQETGFIQTDTLMTHGIWRL